MLRWDMLGWELFEYFYTDQLIILVEIQVDFGARIFSY